MLLKSLVGLLISTPAFAAVQLQEFNWLADNRIVLNLSVDGTQVSMCANRNPACNMREGASVELKAGSVTSTVLAVSREFAVVAVIVDAEAPTAQGWVFALERQNSLFIVLNQAAIAGKPSTLAKDVAGSLEALSKRWDSARAVRSMVAYFDANKGKTMTDFYDQVELGNIKQLAKPQPKGPVRVSSEPVGPSSQDPRSRGRRVPPPPPSSLEEVEADGMFPQPEYPPRPPGPPGRRHPALPVPDLMEGDPPPRNPGYPGRRRPAEYEDEDPFQPPRRRYRQPGPPPEQLEYPQRRQRAQPGDRRGNPPPYGYGRYQWNW